LSGPVLAADALPAAPNAARYQFDTSWPKLPLANKWAMGGVGGIFVDSRDHVWVHAATRDIPNYARGAEQSPPAGDCCVAAPPVIEFDAAGDIVQGWGGPGKGYQWPSYAHGLYVDHKGNVWVAGSQTREGSDGSPADGQILKFTRDGKFLLQIGSAGASKGSLDQTQLSGPSNMVVDPEANEVYVSDGYGNHRVAVFDADSGKFKRHWGAYGKPPTDNDIGRYDPGAPPAQQFRIVHCVRIAKDGLVYVCDRLNNRVQVFKKDGTFVTEWFYDKSTLGAGAVWGLAMWPDANQTWMLNNDGENNLVRILRRSDGQSVGGFGRSGRNAGHFHWVHAIAIDSKGNVYTGEVDTGKRVQKFKPSFAPK
jgi:DNA-binding beta-propeller fold protein YncE